VFQSKITAFGTWLNTVGDAEIRSRSSWPALAQQEKNFLFDNSCRVG
jgi:hypothetical protein